MKNSKEGRIEKMKHYKYDANRSLKKWKLTKSKNSNGQGSI